MLGGDASAGWFTSSLAADHRKLPAASDLPPLAFDRTLLLCCITNGGGVAEITCGHLAACASPVALGVTRASALAQESGGLAVTRQPSKRLPLLPVNEPPQLLLKESSPPIMARATGGWEMKGVDTIPMVADADSIPSLVAAGLSAGDALCEKTRARVPCSGSSWRRASASAGCLYAPSRKSKRCPLARAASSMSWQAMTGSVLATRRCWPPTRQCQLRPEALCTPRASYLRARVRRQEERAG
jgi:hypothetical protein